MPARMTRGELSPRSTMYVGAVLGGAFWGGVWLLSHQAQHYWCAQRGDCSAGPAWWDKQHLATVFGHLWLVIVVGWLTGLCGLLARVRKDSRLRCIAEGLVASALFGIVGCAVLLIGAP